VPQTHNLVRTNNKNDADWIKFDAQSGVKYTIKGTPDDAKGEDLKLSVSLWPDCETPSFGVGAEVNFTAPSSQTYYILVEDIQETYGQKNEYTLAVTAQAGCAEKFEPNNECSLPVDFAFSTGAEGTQNHSFCEDGDEDWIRLETQAGAEYMVTAEKSAGSNADPQLSIFTSCDTSNLPSQEARFTAPTSGYYYIKTENKAQSASNVNMDYDVKIEILAQGCDRDVYEQAGPGGDDKRGDAQLLQIDSSAQSRNICPKRDQDWVQIEATKGDTFTVETYELAQDSDTYLCLYDRSGNKLSCDRDSGAGLGSRVTIQADDDIYYARVTDEDEEIATSTISTLPMMLTG